MRLLGEVIPSPFLKIARQAMVVNGGETSWRYCEIITHPWGCLGLAFPFPNRVKSSRIFCIAIDLLKYQYVSDMIIRIIPRKATNCGFSLTMTTNSCVAQACNSPLFRTFEPCS
jgi:hypothetical protein